MNNENGDAVSILWLGYKKPGSSLLGAHCFSSCSLRSQSHRECEESVSREKVNSPTKRKGSLSKPYVKELGSGSFGSS